MTLREGPNLPNDVKFSEVDGEGPRLSCRNSWSYLIPGTVVLRAAIDAKWVEEIPDPPSFDEVLVSMHDHAIMWDSFGVLIATDDQKAVVRAAVVEARARLAEENR